MKACDPNADLAQDPGNAGIEIAVTRDGILIGEDFRPLEKEVRITVRTDWMEFYQIIPEGQWTGAAHSAAPSPSARQGKPRLRSRAVLSTRIPCCRIGPSLRDLLGIGHLRRPAGGNGIDLVYCEVHRLRAMKCEIRCPPTLLPNDRYAAENVSSVAADG